MIERPGQLKPDVISVKSLRPCLYIAARITAQVVNPRARSHAVKFDEINAPLANHIRNRIHILLGTWIREINFISVGIPIIHNGKRFGCNVLYTALATRSVNL
ncbi:hypothetical protein D3C75_849790 [compost metagenome]